MKWDYWITLYIETFCLARGLTAKTLKAYRDTLELFRRYVMFRLEDNDPDELTPRDILDYIKYLRKERGNGDRTVEWQVTILKNFYRAIVAMGHLEPRDNPLAHFPKIKSGRKKLPIFLTADEVGRLLKAPPEDTVIGIRDRAIMALLYGTGIRVTECAELRECDIDFEGMTIRIKGKGGDERAIPLTPKVMRALKRYLNVRGKRKWTDVVFWSRLGRGMSRHTIYERVRKAGRKAGIRKRVSPHVLRHSFATHLLREGVNLHVLRALLGHRFIGSTQVYVHTTAEDLKRAAALHPVEELIEEIKDLLEHVELPFQRPAVRKEVV